MSITTVANNICQVMLNVIHMSLCIAAAQAQVVPDATLPNNSTVTSQHQNITITGGTQTGANLFHSFLQFSIKNGESVYFDNAPRVDNIIMRVTGRDISNIDGLIRTAGNVNLYLFNPNGIYLGKNAALDIKGSLYLSTAESWKFPQPVNSSLLHISAPIGVQWGSTGNIQVDANLSAQNLNLKANNITITGNVTSSGDITLEATNKLMINDKAKVSVSSHPSGASGNLQLITDKLTIEGGTVSAKTITEGGNVNVYASSLLTLRKNATISTVSIGKSNGANINIEAGFILVNPNGDNDITTNVMQDNGGKIRIFSNAIFGLEKRRTPTGRSDISVTSPALSNSNINITTLNIDPNRGVTQLPTAIVDVSKQINQTCSNQATTNRFVIVGRGGLPLNTTEALSVNSGWIDWRHINKVKENEETHVSTQHQVVEATAWEVENGAIKLVASHKANWQRMINGCNG